MPPAPVALPNPMLLRLVSALLCVFLLCGCGVIRRLTTKHRTYVYAVPVPSVPLASTVHGQTAINEEVRDTYSRYNGGVDSARLAYTVRNNSTDQQAVLQLYVSLSAGVPPEQLDQQAILVETIVLAPAEERTVTLDQAPPNEALRDFLARSLSQRDVTAVHWYVRPASPDPSARVTVQSLAVQVRVHGSYF